MCGINGVFSRKLRGDLVQIGARMNALIQHRGPDDEGAVVFDAESGYPIGSPKSVQQVEAINYLNYQTETVAYQIGWLGHQRLSIIDLSHLGHEPMATSDGRFWLTYNGEIYNYLELKLELESLGVEFISQTDAEVVLKAFVQWGAECVNKFNGMWAFAIYDTKQQSLFASRDRFGVKPFYYSAINDTFAFSSEQKSLVMSGLIPKQINKSAVFDYLAFASIEHEPESFFKGVIELLPGHNLHFDYKNWSVSTYQYYDLNYSTANKVINSNQEQAYIEEIAALFSKAVELRLQSDVPVGACLSGGLDSSAIVTQMHALGAKNINTYTAIASIKELDESFYANAVNKNVHAKSNFISTSAEELLTDLEELVYAQDIPIFSTSTYAQFRVMKQVKQTGVKVVLDGQGGDELFGGYLPYHLNDWMEDIQKGRFMNLRKELKAFESLPKGLQFFVKQYIKTYGLKKLPGFLYKKVIQKFQDEHQYISADLMNAYGNEGYQKSKIQPPKSLNGILKNEFYNSRLKGYLKCEDRCSMWHGVEARVPFADDINLIDYVFNIPGNYKIKNGVKKHLLRSAVAKNLPTEVYERKDKMGYVTPNNIWINQIKGDLKKYFTPDIEEYINRDQLMKNYDTFFNQTHLPENQRMFKFIAFAVWKKTFGV